MQESASVRIFDWDFILSELDRHQIENLVWLSIAPSECKINLVQVEVSETHEHNVGDGYRINCRTELTSGKVIETEVLAADKNRLIVLFGKRLQRDLKRRLTFESSVTFKLFRWAGESTRSLIDSNTWLQTWSRQHSRQSL